MIDLHTSDSYSAGTTLSCLTSATNLKISFSQRLQKGLVWSNIQHESLVRAENLSRERVSRSIRAEKFTMYLIFGYADRRYCFGNGIYHTWRFAGVHLTIQYTISSDLIDVHSVSFEFVLGSHE